MKFVFLFGGALGFAIGVGASYTSDRSPDRILLDGAVGCLAGALLFRWGWSVLLRGIQETYFERQKAAAAAAASAAANVAAAAKKKPS